MVGMLDKSLSSKYQILTLLYRFILTYFDFKLITTDTKTNIEISQEISKVICNILISIPVSRQDGRCRV